MIFLDNRITNNTNKYSWVKRQQAPAVIDVNQSISKLSSHHTLYADAVVETYLLGLNSELKVELAELILHPLV
jgi:hypothetical protein